MVTPHLINSNHTADVLLISTVEKPEKVFLTLYEGGHQLPYTEYSHHQLVLETREMRLLSLPLVPALYIHPRPAAFLQIKGKIADALISGSQWNVSLDMNFSPFVQVKLQTHLPLYRPGSKVKIGVTVQDEYNRLLPVSVDVFLMDAQKNLLQTWTQVKFPNGKT